MTQDFLVAALPFGFLIQGAPFRKLRYAVLGFPSGLFLFPSILMQENINNLKVNFTASKIKYLKALLAEV